MIELVVENEQTMLELGARLARVFRAGDLVLFEGELGAGKTTIIRGILNELGWKEPVRSPTFNLFSIYNVNPPVLHADLYRVASPMGTGLEDYLESHLCLIEWPKGLEQLADLSQAKTISIQFEGEGRRVLLNSVPKLSNISI